MSRRLREPDGDCVNCTADYPEACEHCETGRAIADWFAGLETEEEQRPELVAALSVPTSADEPPLLPEVFGLARAVAELVAEVPFSLVAESIQRGVRKPTQGGLF